MEPSADISLEKPYDPEVHMTSIGKRLANFLIDMIMYYLLVFVVAIVMAIVFSLFAPQGLEAMETNSGPSLWSYVLAIIVHVSYYTMMESVFGRTVGKLITGTRVVDKKGKTPDTGTIFRRSLSRIVPFEWFSFLGSQPRGWHDTWTDTYVVDKN